MGRSNPQVCDDGSETRIILLLQIPGDVYNIVRFKYVSFEGVYMVCLSTCRPTQELIFFFFRDLAICKYVLNSLSSVEKKSN